jgi:uncharacterized phage protein (TIGR02218 family)
MRTINAALTTHYALGATTFAHGLLITREDGEVFAFTSASEDATISSQVYGSAPGLDVTQIAISAGLAVGNLELTTLHDGEVFTTAAIRNGLWRNAAFEVFRYNRESVSDGRDVLLAGTFGEVEIRANTVVAELRDLRQYFQQPLGAASSKLCRYRLGSASMDAGGLCNVVLDGSPGYVEVVTVTGVTSNQVFQCSGAVFADDWFGEGEVEGLTGNNAGVRAKVKSFHRGSPPTYEFTLLFPLAATVQVGDTFSATAGCRKRLAEDCLGKFNNVLNFGGEPHRQGLNELTQAPGPSV